MERARVLLSQEKGGSLRVSSLQDRVEFRSENKLAAMPAILRVHDINYVMKLINGCQKSKVFIRIFDSCSKKTGSFRSISTLRSAARASCKRVALRRRSVLLSTNCTSPLSRTPKFGTFSVWFDRRVITSERRER